MTHPASAGTISGGAGGPGGAGDNTAAVRAGPPRNGASAGTGAVPGAPDSPEARRRLEAWYRTMCLARAVDELMWILGA
jgi:hypothetical protein